jgi:hypothetical protein
LFECVSVKIADVFRHSLAFGIEPGTLTNTISRIDGTGPLGAEIGVPGAIARIRCCREPLAVRVGSRYPAQIGAFAYGHARNEKRHRRRWTLLLLGERQGRNQHGQCERAKHPLPITHILILFSFSE